MCNGKIKSSKSSKQAIHSGRPSQSTYRHSVAEGLSQVHWIDNDTKLIYPDPDGSLKIRDLESGETTPLRWKRPVGGFTYWDSERNLVWCDTNTGGFTSYQMIGDELRKVGTCKNLPYRSFFADGTRVLIASVDLASCDVVDVASGEVLRTLHSPRRSAATWRIAHDHAICLYGDGQLGANGQFSIAGAAVFDPHSGKLLHDVDFDAVVTGITFDRERLRFIATRADLQVEAYDLAGSRTVIVPSPFRWWWPARTLFIALASAWWLAWLWLLRSKRRSMKAFVDIAILHAIVFSCMCLRTQAYVHGPSWNGAVISWETVGFFASTISMVLWFLVWTVLGPQRWALRVAAFVLAASFVSIGMMNMWSAASNYAGDIVVGLLSSVGALFAMLWLAHAIGIRLRHVSDPDEALPGPVKRQVFVRDLFLWLLAFGLFFAVIKAKEFPLPDPTFAWTLVAENTVIAASAMLTMWLALGSIRWRIPIVSIGFASAWYFLQWIEPIELLAIGSYANAMIFVSRSRFATTDTNCVANPSGSRPRSECRLADTERIVTREYEVKR